MGKFKVISSQFKLSQVQASSGTKDRLSMLIPTKLSGGGGECPAAATSYAYCECKFHKSKFGPDIWEACPKLVKSKGKGKCTGHAYTLAKMVHELALGCAGDKQAHVKHAAVETELMFCEGIISEADTEAEPKAFTKHHCGKHGLISGCGKQFPDSVREKNPCADVEGGSHDGGGSDEGSESDEEDEEDEDGGH